MVILQDIIHRLKSWPPWTHNLRFIISGNERVSWVYYGHVRNLDFFIIQIDRIRYVLSSYTRTRIEKVGSCIFLSLQAWSFNEKVRDRPLEQLWGAGWAKYKKDLCKRKLREKFSCTASSPEKSSCTQKKYSCKGNVNEKNSCSSKIPHHPHIYLF